MKDLFVPYELAKQLKEKGFDEPCFAWYKICGEPCLFYVEGGEPENNNFKLDLSSSDAINAKEMEDDYNKNSCSAPLYQQIVDWLREKHSIIVEVCYSGSMNNYCAKNIKLKGNWNFAEHEKGKMWTTENYHEALNKAIEEALKLIK